ncbi:uncharacterized protein LOC142233746 [Haematobia irritans]|uniref:uncharacterized protein LOC142233746 n=1 Tax=Haematobia irritans TaxID=7368 RepID=UPI003F50B9DA
MNGIHAMGNGHRILENYGVLKKIFQYLSLQQQLEMLDVCESFRYVIVDLIWIAKYRTLHMYHTLYKTLIVDSAKSVANEKVNEMAIHDFIGLNKIKEAKSVLKVQQYKRFLRANCHNVRYLKVYSEYYDFKGFQGVTMNNIEIFHRLRYLSLYKLVVTNDQMKLLSQHCGQLQKIELNECFCSELTALIPGDNLEIENLARMPCLVSLIIQCDHTLTTPGNEMESSSLLRLLNDLRLTSLQLRNITIVDNRWPDNETTKALEVDSSSMETLDIGWISDEFWPIFKNLLKKFFMLRDLSIRVTNCYKTIDVPIVETLSTTCTHLERLFIDNCDLQVGDFSVFKSLRDLSLSNCGGFTFANLQEVLGGLHLKRFTLINTRVLGDIHHIYVSPSLESITVDTILYSTISQAFQKSLNKFENLYTLNWVNGDINDNWIIDKCPNLQVLYIPNVYLLRRVVFTMKSLQHLTFTSCKGLSWHFIWILIKNLSLKSLNLQTHDLIHDHKEIPNNTKTTLRSIIIPFGIFKEVQTFWLDLMYLNRHLKIVFYGSHEDLLHTNFIRNLLKHQHFPQRLRYIKICGFTTDILDLRTKLMGVLQEMNMNTSHYRSRNLPFTIEM